MYVSSYIDTSKFDISKLEPNSYFASILPSSIIKQQNLYSNSNDISIPKETKIKQFIQSMNNEELKDNIYQFLLQNDDINDKFIEFIDNKKSKLSLNNSSENWKIVDGFKGRNWSEEYCQLLSSMDSDSFNWQQQMYRLSDDFFHASSLYAQIIISELPLPTSLKSIQPVNVGGIAGGEKYIVDNILFKFAIDSNIGENGSNIYMYGGDKQRNDLAMKAASIEMRNMQTILTNRGDSIFVPLMCVIDYQGQRIIASSILPIDKSTLVYGSADGGHSVKKTIPELNNIVKELADKLNLVEHFTGSKRGGERLYMPGDIEIHEGLDGRYYMLDLARLMPPEAPKILNTKFKPLSYTRKIFYQTLRPELVLGFREKLSSDAFSGWCEYEPFKKDHNNNVRACTDFLLNSIIPQFAKSLENFKLEAIPYLPSSRDFWLSISGEKLKTILTVADMSTSLHYYGINVRHLGLIRKHLEKEFSRDFLLAHCTARAIKNIFREQMRKKMKKSLGSPSDLPLRDLVLKSYKNIHPFNHITNNNPLTNKMKIYWEKVYTTIQEQYEECFNENEQREIESKGLHRFINQHLDFRVIIFLFFRTAQITVSSYAFKELLAPCIQKDTCLMQNFRLVRSDVKAFTPRIRKPYLSSYASALLLSSEANNKKLAKSNQFRLLFLSTRMMTCAHKATPMCATINYQLGMLYWKQSGIDSEPVRKLHSKFWAIRHLELAISIESFVTNELLDEFNKLLHETEIACEKMGFCTEALTKIKERNHNGIASCAKARLATGSCPKIYSTNNNH